MKKIIILVCFIILFLVSCNNESNDNNYIPVDKTEESNDNNETINDNQNEDTKEEDKTQKGNISNNGEAPDDGDEWIYLG